MRLQLARVLLLVVLLGAWAWQACRPRSLGTWPDQDARFTPNASRPPFLGTWVQGDCITSFNSDGTYLQSWGEGSGHLGRWKPVGRDALEMTDETGTIRVTWAVSEDGKALFTSARFPEELKPLFGQRNDIRTVYTRK